MRLGCGLPGAFAHRLCVGFGVACPVGGLLHAPLQIAQLMSKGWNGANGIQEGWNMLPPRSFERDRARVHRRHPTLETRRIDARLPELPHLGIEPPQMRVEARELHDADRDAQRIAKNREGE